MKYSNNKGFSLIELLIAVTVLAIGLLAIAGLQATAIRGNFHANTISQATSFAEQGIEAIRNMDYANIVAIEPEVDRLYTRVTLIEVVTSLPDLKRITVTVTWDANGAHQVVLRTIVANGG